MKNTKSRDIKNIKAAIAYNDAHVKDHTKHLNKMLSKRKHVAKIPVQLVKTK